MQRIVLVGRRIEDHLGVVAQVLQRDNDIAGRGVVGRCVEGAERVGATRGAGLVGAAHGGQSEDVILATVGGDEVDQRFRVAQVAAEVLPARVGRDAPTVAVVGRVFEEPIEGLLAHFVEGRQADVAGARDVDRREVERNADGRLLQCAGDELVDRVGVLIEQAERDAARAVILVERRAEEGIEQVVGFEGRDVARLAGIHAIAVRDRDPHGFGILRMAEAEHGLRELEADAHVDV